MMKPYPRSGKLDIRKKVFNYRLSRARRVVESAFGILVTRWRIYRRPIIAAVTHVLKFVKATLVLHNFIIKNEEKVTKKNTYIHITSQGRHGNHSGINILPVYQGRSNNNAISVWKAYSTYFQGSGALSSTSGRKRFKMIFNYYFTLLGARHASPTRRPQPML